MLLLFQIYSFPQDFWKQTNGPGGNDVYSVVKDSEGTIYSTILNFGLFKSTNDGYSWSQLKGSPIQRWTTEILLNSNENLVLSTLGVYVSTDKGLTWIQSNLPQSSVLKLEKTFSGSLLASTQYGIYRSSDGGYNWSEVNTGFLMFSDLTNVDNGYVFASGFDGIFKSTDDGLSWEITSFDSGNIAKIFWNGNSLFAYDNSNIKYYRSTDYGEDWELLSTPEEMNSTFCMCSDSFGNIYAGSNTGLYRSTNNGNSWSIFAFPNYYITSLHFIDNKLFVGTVFNSFWRTTDGGITWQQIIDGLTNSDVNSLSVLEPNDIMVGSLRGFSISNDGGNHWSRNNQGLYNNLNYAEYDWVWDILVLPNQDILIATYYGGLYKSELGLGPWEKIALQYNTGHKLARNPNGVIVFDTGNKIIRSTNNGQSWEETNAVFAYTAFISVSPNNVFFSAGQSGRVYYSTDEGINWGIIDTANGAPGKAKCIAYNVNGDILIGDDKLYKSTDDGLSWTSKEIKPQILINSLAINSEGEIFAAITSFESFPIKYEVYSSNDQGNSFYPISNGLENHKVNKLVIDSYGFVYAGTDSNGVYKSIGTTVDVLEGSNIPRIFQLSQNYPNPFNPSTSIQYAISSTQLVTLKVYDLLGREVATLVNEEKPAGSYSVEFRMQNLPTGQAGLELSSGIYFYKLQAGSFVETKKMILMK